MVENRIAAFFDFDRTLLEVESGQVGIQWLKDHGMLPLGFALKIFIAHAFYRRHLIPEERMVRFMLTFYRKRRLADFQAGSEQFYEEYLKPRLAPKILLRLDFHKKAKHRLVLISGSLRYMLQPVAESLGFHHLLCTDLEQGEDGLLTGKPAGPICVGTNKRLLMLELAGRTGIDLHRSYAYGNHQADIPILEIVGNPHVVEPTAPLMNVALEKSWPVLSFR